MHQVPEISRELSTSSAGQIPPLTGTGSVGLFWLAQQPHEAQLTAVEAQEESVELLSRTVKLLKLEQRVQLINGDLRNEPWPHRCVSLSTNLITVSMRHHATSLHALE